MLMLLCAVTTWAQTLVQITTDTSKPIYYTIYNTRSDSPGGLLYYAGDNAGLKDGCNVTTLENKYKFYFTGSDDALYVHNAATTNKLAAVDSWTAEGTVWCVIKREDGNLAFGTQGGDANAKVWWNEQNQGRDGYTVWTANDAGSGFVLELASEFTYPEVGKFYTIEAPLFEKVQGVAKGLVANGGNSLGWNTVDLANKNYYWTLVKDAETDALYLKNVGTGYYINGDAVRENAAALTTNALGSNQFNIITNSVKLHAASHDGGNGSSGGVTGWDGAANSASAWKFVEREDPDAVKTLDITYNFTYKGVNKGTQTKTVLVGEEYPDIEISFPFGITATKPDGNVAENSETTITIVLEENLPFVYAASYDAVTNWYYVKNKGEFYLSHVENQGNIALGNDQKTVDASKKDAFTWAFVGNPFDGFKLVNKAAGNGKVLSSSTTIEGDGANTFPVMTESPVAEGNNELWVLTASGHQANGFFIAQKGYANNRMNNRNSKLAYWTGGADNGSTFTVELRNDEEELLAALAEAQELVNSITGEGVGYATSASIKAVQDAIDAKELVALQNAIANIKTNQPEEGKFYNIISSCTKDHRANQLIYVNNDGNMHFCKPEDTSKTAAGTIGHVFQFVPADNGKFYIYNVQRGRYMQTLGVATETDVKNAKPVTITNMGSKNIVTLVPDGQSQMHAQDSNSKIVGWNENNYTDGSAWIISEVTDITKLSHELTVGEVGYATLCLGYNATIPAGVEAYAVSEINEGYVSMTAVTGAIPANEAVILKKAEGQPAEATTYKFNYAESATAVETNFLEGTTVNTNIEEDAYVLGKDENNVAYLGKAVYNVSTDTSNDGTKEEPNVTYEAWKNNANKAYLPAVAGSANIASYSFRFEEGTTGINEVKGENGNVKTIYDLTGRRVEAITAPGIYIVNGKKVLVK